MNKITAIVEIADNNLSAYLQNIDGIVAVGQNLEELKQSMNESIALYLEVAQEYREELPSELQGEYEITYKYDMQSFLTAYAAFLSKSGLERLTGINQKQLWHYASGTSKPKRSTVDKVAASIHSLGHELQNIEFV